MSHAKIELFYLLYDMWHCPVEVTYWPYQYHLISAERAVVSCRGIEGLLFDHTHSEKIRGQMMPSAQIVTHSGCIRCSTIICGLFELQIQ